MSPKALTCCLILSAAGCAQIDESSVEVDASFVEMDASVTVDASAPVPDAVSSYDCVPSPREQMGASPDATATFQIWLDGSTLYTCHAGHHPSCQGFGGSPIVYACTMAQLTEGGVQ